jgi:hypothetical protein
MCVSDAHGIPNPIVFYGRTEAGALVRFREDIDHALIGRLAQVMPLNAVPYPIPTLPASATAIGRIIREVMPENVMWSGPAYVLTKLPPAPGIHVIRASAESLSDGFARLLPRLDGVQPIFCVVERGKAVSACFSARTTNNAAEGGVETLEQFRGRGYAVAVTRSWALEIQHSGRLALYSTSWTNIQSMSVAAKLGAYRFGADFHVSDGASAGRS